MVRHGILAPRLPGSNPGTLVSGRFFCSLCFSSPAGTMMLHAICIVHLLSNTPLVESWLKIRHKDRRGLLEHLSHDAQACKSTYAFWHERSRNRRCHFIQNPPGNCMFLSGKCVGRPLFVQTERWFESILAITRHRIYSCDRLVLLEDWWAEAGMPVGGFHSFTPT